MAVQSDEKVSSWMFWTQRRYVVTLLAFFGFFISYLLRVNLSVAIVKMTENRTFVDGDGVVRHEAEFPWDSRVQGLVLSSFFYGYISTQLLGGWLAARIGGKHVFGFGLAATSVFTLVTPPVARCNFYMLVALRVLEGICEGVTYPAVNALWARWLPPLERSKLGSFAYSGSYVGTIVAMPLAGFIVENSGWAAVFYSFGVVGLCWYACWCYFVTDSPEDDDRISEAELKMIRTAIGPTEKRVSHPWRAMLTSPVLWVIIILHVSDSWGFVTLLTFLPTYMSDVLNFKIQDAGILAALPYVGMALSMQIAGRLADYLRARKILTTTQVRKLMGSGGTVIQAVFTIAAGYATSPTMAIVCLVLAGTFGAFSYSGFCINYLDIAPQHASVLLGIGQTIATMTGIVSPMLTGYIVQNKSAAEWRTVFLITGVIYIFGAVVYAIWTKAELQPWAVVDSRAKKKEQDSEAHHDNPAFETDK